MLFKRLLVANRGEIAIRIFRAATELEIRTIGIYSHEDRFALHRFKCDEAYHVGKEGDPLGAYLNWSQILDKAIEVEADAIHPGYGFLSENAEFAAACKERGIVFCGPSSDVLKTFGDKLSAKKAAVSASIAVIPGSTKPIATADQALAEAKKIGFPVTIKAVSGGGGKGIRKVNEESEFLDSLERAKSEAQSSFGQADVYIEKTIVNPKHIEVQIIGDSEGEIVHLFER
ncbi:carbamoyl phosphate synthase, partial [Oligoflexaceae bacterium]|nr:carbamoyl phosphate synthase [Oligoflexaceae bacterium]